MKHLWMKIAFFATVVTVLALGATALFAHLAFNQLFSGYLTNTTADRNEKVQRVLESLYQRDGNWSRLPEQMPYFCMMTGTCVKVVDASGHMQADYCVNRDYLKDQFPIDHAYDTVLALSTGGRPIGTAYLNSSAMTGVTPAQAFRGLMTQSLVVTAGVSTVAIVILTLLLAPWILSPIQRLTAGAQAVAAGDLTHRVSVASSDEVGRLADAFNHMVERLEAQEQLRKKLTADVAHELRTPLATLRASVEAVQDGVVPLTAATAAGLHEEVMRLVGLVDDLQELAVVEGVVAAHQTAALDLSHVIRQAVRSAQPRCAARQVALAVEAGEEPLPMLGDARLLERALSNLLDNALKYTPAGGRITITAGREGRFLALRVADTGTGIDPADLPHVFERFYRADPSRTRATGGAGIGLSIVQEIAHAHGGRVEAASDPGHGSVFTLWLPFAAA